MNLSGKPRTSNGPRLALPAAALLGALLGGLLCAQPTLAAKTAATSDCQHLLELYRACHSLGTQADSARTCQEASQDYAVRAETRIGGKNPQAVHVRAEVVCATGCEDAVTGQPPATVQEFTEAFCEPAPAAKPQGGRP